MMQYPLFVMDVPYDKKRPETFYFHYWINYAALGVVDREPALIYTGVPVGNTIGLEKILKILEENNGFEN